MARYEVDETGYEETTDRPKRPDRSAALKHAHEAAAYDRWFRCEVAQALKEANDPNMRWRTTEEVMASVDPKLCSVKKRSARPFDVQVVWLPRTETNLLDIVEHIAEDNIPAALALAKLIRVRAEQLSEPPTLFRKGRARGTLEMVVHPNYIVVYRVRARLKRVEILRVLHAARQLPHSS